MARKKDLVEIFEMGRRSKKPTGGTVHWKERESSTIGCKGIPKDVAISMKTGSLRADE
jgi:hypothetical protein